MDLSDEEDEDENVEKSSMNAFTKRLSKYKKPPTKSQPRGIYFWRPFWVMSGLIPILYITLRSKEGE